MKHYKAPLFSLFFVSLFLISCNIDKNNNDQNEEKKDNDITIVDPIVIQDDSIKHVDVTDNNNPDTIQENITITDINNKKRPNIIIFYADDLGYQPECYGGEVARTPYINQIARNGILFKDGYVSACVCSPSRAALLTGRYQARTGHDGNSNEPGEQLNTREVTLAQRLKDLGYTTGMFGKWHLGHWGKKQFPTAKGFDVFIGNTGNLNDARHDYYHNEEVIDEIKGHPRTSKRWTSEAVDFIDNNKENPFFIYLPFHAVHTPRLSNKKNFDKYEDYEVMEKRRFASVLDELDESIGDVMNKLRAESLEENTLIFFISDNGVSKFKQAEIKNGGLKGNKWELWEGGIRVPFMMQWKGKLPGGVVSETPVIQIDVFPTALAAARGELDKAWNIDGENLLPLFAEEKKELKRESLFWRFGTQFAIRKGKWKLVKVYSDQEKPILVDLENDLGEGKDMTNEHPEKALELQEAWDEWNSTMKPPRWQDDRWNIKSPSALK